MWLQELRVDRCSISGSDDNDNFPVQLSHQGSLVTLNGVDFNGYARDTSALMFPFLPWWKF